MFPNNKNEGYLEKLLEKIATKSGFIECFNCYVKCIESKEKGAGKNIYKKSKWYAYKEASGLLKAEKKKEQINYQEYFDFEHEALENLKNFLFKQHNK